MGQLYLVRHGQASLGADDYDQLSPRGREQGLRLGEYWRNKVEAAGTPSATPFDAVLIGTLKRHRQTWEDVSTGAPGHDERYFLRHGRTPRISCLLSKSTRSTTAKDRESPAAYPCAAALTILVPRSLRTPPTA